MKNKIGIFPGSFDPITSGHRHIIEKASKLVDVLIVGIGDNSSKKSFYSLEKREDWVKNTFKNYDNILVKKYNGLTINFAEKENAKFIITGDPGQVDLPRNAISGIKEAILILKNTPGVGIVHLDESDVIRNKLVKKIVDAYKNIENNN